MGLSIPSFTLRPAARMSGEHMPGPGREVGGLTGRPGVVAEGETGTQGNRPARRVASDAAVSRGPNGIRCTQPGIVKIRNSESVGQLVWANRALTLK
jgi:hypothetical protein